MAIKAFTPESKVSEYQAPVDAEIAELIEAGENWEGEGIPASDFQVPTVDANRVKTLIQKRANAVGKTARIRGVEDDGKLDKDGKPVGNTVITFTLRPKDAARPGAGRPAGKSEDTETVAE